MGLWSVQVHTTYAVPFHHTFLCVWWLEQLRWCAPARQRPGLCTQGVLLTGGRSSHAPCAAVSLKQATRSRLQASRVGRVCLARVSRPPPPAGSEQDGHAWIAWLSLHQGCCSQGGLMHMGRFACTAPGTVLAPDGLLHKCPAPVAPWRMFVDSSQLQPRRPEVVVRQKMASRRSAT